MSENDIHELAPYAVAGAAALTAGAIFVASRGRAAKAAEALMESVGAADAAKVEGLNLLNLARPKQLSIIEDGIQGMASRANVTTVDFRTNALDRLLAGGTSTEAQGAKVIPIDRFRGKLPQPSGMNEATEDLLNGQGMYFDKMRVAMNPLGLTTISRFSKGTEEVLFKPSGAGQFSDISSLLKGKRELALPAGDLQIKGATGSLTRLRLDGMANAEAPILFPKVSGTKVEAIPLELSNGAGTSLDGTLQWTDTRVARLGSWAHVVNGGGKLEATVGHASRTGSYEKYFSTNTGTFEWNGVALKPNMPRQLEGPGVLTFRNGGQRQMSMFRDEAGSVFQVKDPKSFRFGDGITFATDTR